MTELKEELYINLINNLLKKIEFLHLCNDFENDIIDEEKFHNELEENVEQYIPYSWREFDSETNLAINEILENLEFGGFSINNIEEMFSILPNGIYEYMNNNKLNKKD